MDLELHKVLISGKIMQYLKSKRIRMIFIPVLLYVAIQMFMRGIGG